MIEPKLKPAPKRAVEQGGQVNYGYYLGEFAELNLLDAPLDGRGSREPRLIRKLRLKEWQHVALISPTHWVSLSMVNAQYLNVSWCYVFDRESGELIEHKHNARPGAVRVPRELWNDTCSFVLPGYGVRIHNQLAQGRHVIEIDIAATKKLPAFAGRVIAYEDPDEVQPLIPLLPMSSGRTFYTHKVPTPIEGELTVGERKLTFERGRDVALFDVHKAFYPFRTYWNWATFAGRDEKGGLIGASFTQGTAFDGREHTENCLWSGNTIALLPQVRFEVPKDTLDRWKLSTLDGRCELEFEPQGQRSESIRVGPIISEYFQPFGLFNGFIVDEQGVRREIKNQFGCTEKHASTW
ncbi:MAG: DUF2804 domain-containing protein [Candidatus Alcyoniella australis]|nr:DUF2804 domain-containing protein [Candidatus Alcyoniella australis]